MKASLAKEGAAVLQRALALLNATPADVTTEDAANLRRACGALNTDAEAEIRAGTAPDTLMACFDFAYAAGATFDAVDRVRRQAGSETPAGAVGKIVAAQVVRLCLALQAKLVAATTFVSTQDVDAMQTRLNGMFESAEVFAADDGATDVYRALVKLQAALTRDLSARARLLPRMVGYRVATSFPAVVLANRFYGDASRADEIRLENKAKHPLFLPRTGRALSA